MKKGKRRLLIGLLCLALLGADIMSSGITVSAVNAPLEQEDEAGKQGEGDNSSGGDVEEETSQGGESDDGSMDNADGEKEQEAEEDNKENGGELGGEDGEGDTDGSNVGDGEDVDEIEGSGDAEERVDDGETLVGDAEERLALMSSDDDIASGTYGNIAWVIDANGKLTVEGTGDYSDSIYGDRAPWNDYRMSVISAKIKVTGMTNASFMFGDCINLTSVDTSGFDTSKVTDMSCMFIGCDSLATLDVSSFITSNVTDVNSMFDGCSSLTTLDVSRFDTGNVTRMDSMFDRCSNLTTLDVSGFDTSNVTDMGHMFDGCGNLTTLDVSGFDTSNVMDMQYMFKGCSSLATLDVGGFDTNNVTRTFGMQRMFEGCSNLITLDVSGFDTSNVIDMSWLFYGCSSLTTLDVSRFDTGKVTSMEGMFRGCSSLTTLDVSRFDTGNVTWIDQMFCDCKNLKVLDVSNFNTGNVTWMQDMFMNCKSLTTLDVSGFDTSNVTDMRGMFNGCSSLTSMDLGNFNTGNVTDMGFMFYGCSGLTSMDLRNFNTENVTYMDSMFYGCNGLTSLDIGNFNIGNVIYMREMFDGCSSLTTIYTPYNVSECVELPVNPGDTWYRSDGTTVTELPQNLDYSVALGKNYIPQELPAPIQSKLYVTMECEGQTYDLLNEKQVLNVASSKKVSISMKLENMSPSKYALMQDNKIILENSTGSFSGIFPQDLFAVDQSIYAVIYDGNNEELVKRKLTLTISYHLQDRLTLSTETLRLTVYQNQKNSTSMTDKYKLAKDVMITCNNTCYTTNSNGIVSIPSVFSGDVIVEKKGYITRTLTAEQLAESTEIYLQKESKDAPVVYAVWIKNVDVLSHSYAINMLSTAPTTLTAEVDWGDSSMGSIKLVQDARTANFDGYSLTTTLSDKFDTSRKIYILATDTNGKYTKKELKLENGTVSKALKGLDGASFSVGDKISIKLPDSFEPSLFAGETISAGISSAIPITLSADDGKIYVSIGIDLVNYKKSTGNEDEDSSNKDGDSSDGIKEEVKIFNRKLKDTKLFEKEGIIDTSSVASSIKKLANLQETYKKAIKNPKGSWGVTADFTVLGFAEGCYDENGTITWFDSGVIFNPSVSVSKDLPFIMPVGPVPVPMFFETSLSADVLAQFNIIFNKTAKNFIPNGEISGEITLSGGVGVGIKKVLYAGGGLEGKLEPDWKIFAASENHFKLTASLNAYAKAGFLVFEGKRKFGPIYDEVWIDYPSSAASVASLDAVSDFNLYDVYNYKVKDLSYLNGNSEFVANDSGIIAYSITGTDKAMTTLKTNIYREATPKYIVFDDGRCMAVWLDSKDGDANNVCLYYSYYDGTVWSEPAVVLDDGTMDYEPCIAKVGDTVCVAWQNAVQSFSITEDLTADDIAADFDISAAIFNMDDRTFTATTFNRANLDMLPAICSENGNIYVAWVNNGENDWFGNNDKNSIMYSEYDGSAWSTPIAMYDGLYAVDSLAIDYEDGLHFAYSLDMDGNLNTVDDIKVYENGQRVSAGDVYESSPAYCNHELYWYTQNNIVNRKMDVKIGNITSDRYLMLELNGETAVIYPESNGLYTTLMISYLNEDVDAWGNAKALTDGDTFIGAFDAAVTSNGELELLINSQKVVGEMTDNEPYGVSELTQLSYNQYCNLSMGEPLFDETTFCKDEPMRFAFELINNGMQTINSVTVEIMEDDGTILSSTDIYDQIVPGDTVEVSASFIVAEAASEKNITIKATPDGLSDIDLSDNTQRVTLGYEDICVENITYGEMEDGEISISADIVNRGYSEKTGVEVALLKESLEGSVIETKQIASIGSMDLETVSFAVEADELGIYYIVVSKGDDEYTANNSDFVMVSISENSGNTPGDDPDNNGEDDDSDTVLPDDIPAEGIPSDLWIAGIDASGYTYTGKPIKPTVRVYDGDKMLKAGRDYTISYKNNTKANDASNTAKAPTITVTGKGNYGGKETATFKILPVDLNDTSVITEDITLAYNDKLQKKIPTLTYNGKKLSNNKDFIASYPALEQGVADAYKAVGTYEILLTAKQGGSFVGTRTVNLTITDSILISKAKVSKIPAQYYLGFEMRPYFTVTYNDTALVENEDYTFTYENNIAPGKAAIILTGIGGYAGTKKVYFTIKGPAFKNVTVDGIENKVYNGSRQEQQFYVRLDNIRLTEGVDYEVEYSNNQNAGKATITIKGINAYTGTAKKTFKIFPYNVLEDMGLGEDITAKYVKGGSKPEIELAFAGKKMVEGRDYTVSYRNNKEITTIETNNKPTLTVKGKGNFTGSLTKTFTIISKELNDADSPVTLTAADKGFINKAGKYISKPTLTDADGKKLAAGKDYEKEIIYTLEDGTLLTNESIVDAGTNVKVKVVGKGAYYGELETTYRITEYDFSKAKVKITPQIYTGSHITLDKDDITVKIGEETLTYGTDYEIVQGSYANNKNKGTASVTIAGKGNYGGMKVSKFKITAKGVVWFWRMF